MVLTSSEETMVLMFQSRQAIRLEDGGVTSALQNLFHLIA